MRAQLSPTGRRILLSTVSSDSHTWNLVFLQLLLEELGHEVVNLGPCVPDELLIETAAAERPDAIVISSVNGHGHLDGVRLIRAVRADPRIGGIPAMIGGKLGVQGSEDTSYVRELTEAGFDAVFVEGAPEAALHAFLGVLPASTPARDLAVGTS
ncbi:cobalamin B12-binding domain-containing protein [Streptomyces sp. NPDC059567]|uniref:cobalamin B12-binding domain-containing protein n=1 Tax=Streptomyces sp. NPDC059567 TaxID=3346867 RepID=UPI0036821099